MRLLLVALVLLPTLARAQAVDRPIVFGMTPVVGVESTKQRFTPLTEHLSVKLRRPVALLVAGSYGDLIEQVAQGEVHIAKLSPLAYVRARRQIPTLKLLASHVAYGTVTYSSYLVTLQDSQFQTLDKLKGARICFADPDSTSGFLYPSAYIQEKLNLSPNDLNSYFAGSHRACLEDLLAGKCDLATSWTGALRDARQAGLEVGALIIVAKTGRIPYDAYCVHPDLDKNLIAQIRRILLNTSTLSPEGRKILSPTLGINGWVSGNDQTYDDVRRIESQIQGGDNQ